MIDEEKTFERVLEKILTARPPEETAKALIEAQLFLERSKVRSQMIEKLERILQQPGDRIQSLRGSGLIELGEKEFPFDYPFPDEQEHIIRHQLELLRAWNEGVTITGSPEVPPYHGTQHLEPYKGLLRQNPSCYPDSPTYFSSALRVVDEGLKTGPNHSWFGFGSQSGYEQFLEKHLPRVELNTFKFWQAMREGYDMTPIFFKDERGHVWSGMKNPVQRPFYFKKKPWGPDTVYMKSNRSTLPSKALVSTLISLNLTDGRPEWLEDKGPSNTPFDFTSFSEFQEVCDNDRKGILPLVNIERRLRTAAHSNYCVQDFLKDGGTRTYDHGPSRLLNVVDSLISEDNSTLEKHSIRTLGGRSFVLTQALKKLIRQRVEFLLKVKKVLSASVESTHSEIEGLGWRFLTKESE